MIFALLGSLVVAMVILPVLATLLFRKRPTRPAGEEEAWLVRVTRWRYVRLLHWTMAHRGATVLVALATLALTGLVARRLGTEFVPKLDEGDLVVNALRLPSVSMSESVASSLMVERVLKQFPELALVVSRTGSPEVATDLMGIELSDIFVILKPRNQWTSARTKGELIEKMEDHLSHEIPGLGLSFTQPIEMRFNELMAGVKSDVGVKIFGDDLDVLKRKADEVARVLGSIRGRPTLPNKWRVCRWPVSPWTAGRSPGTDCLDVLDTVEAIRARPPGRTIYEGRKRIDLVARFPDAVGKDLEALAQSRWRPIRSRQILPLGQLAKLEYATGRESAASRSSAASSWNPMSGEETWGLCREARDKVARQVKLEPGYYMEWGGQFENLERASARLLLVVPLTWP